MEKNTIRREIVTFLTDKERLTRALEDMLKGIKKKDSPYSPALLALETEPFETDPTEGSQSPLARLLTALSGEDRSKRIAALRHTLRAFTLCDEQALKNFIPDRAQTSPIPLMLDPVLFEDADPKLNGKEEVTLVCLILSLMTALEEEQAEHAATLPEQTDSPSFSYETACARYLDVILAFTAKKLTNISVSPYLAKLVHGKADAGVSPDLICERALREADRGTNLNRADDLRGHVSAFSFPASPTLSASSASSLSALWLIRDIMVDGATLLDKMRPEPEGEIATFFNSDPARAATQLAEVRSSIFSNKRVMTSDSLLKQVYVPDTTEHHGSQQPFFLVQPCWGDEVWNRLSEACRRTYERYEDATLNGLCGQVLPNAALTYLAIGGSNPQNISTRIASGGNPLLSCAPPSHERKPDLLSTYAYRVKKLVADLVQAYSGGGFRNRRSADRIVLRIAKVFARIIADNANYNAMKQHGSATLASDVATVIQAYRTVQNTVGASESVLDFRTYQSIATFTLSHSGLVDSKLVMQLAQAMANELNKVGV